MFQRFLGLIFILSAATLSASAQEVVQLDANGDWSAHKYTDAEGGLVCFITSKPTQMEGNYTRRGPVWLQVTHRQQPGNASNKTNVVSFSAGFRFLEDHQPILSIGTKQFRMHTQGETAWSFPGDDAELTRALREGNTLTIETKSWRGTEIRDTFSLRGVTAMHNRMSEECGVDPL